MANRSAPDWLIQWEYAHRGLHGTDNSKIIPENSLAAAKLAISRNMGIECDIQRSADDVPMVFHDWDLNRLLGDTRDTKGARCAEIEQLRYLGTDENPAPLSGLLDLVDGRVPILIEIKSKPGYDVARSCEIVADSLASYTGSHAVMSFDPKVARWFRYHHAQTCVGLVMREDDYGFTQKWWQRRLALWIAKPDFLAYHIAALPSPWVSKLRKNGLPTLTWTVNSQATRSLAKQHADALISEGSGLARQSVS